MTNLEAAAALLEWEDSLRRLWWFGSCCWGRCFLVEFFAVSRSRRAIVVAAGFGKARWQIGLAIEASITPAKFLC